jgi:hypothetical protein
MKIFYEQIITIIDASEQPGDDTMTDLREPIIQYFMLNKFCQDLMENAYCQMLNGFYQVKYAALDFYCKVVINIASSIKRQ